MNEHDDEGPVKGLETLTRARRPARDLWPGIEARLAPRARRSRLWLAQAGLAASLVVGMAAMFTLQLAHTPAATPAETMSAFADVGPLETHSRAIVKANLSIVRSAEDQLRQALRQDPDSPALRSLLASTENRGRVLRAML